MKKLIVCLFVSIFVACALFTGPISAWAEEAEATQEAKVAVPYEDDSTPRENNKYGMHIAVPDDQDIERVAKLVNSSGGDWGYITMVIHEDDRDIGKWQQIFDKLRDYHLIPIIRIATKAEGSNWRRPTKEDAGQWAEFLNSLNWVVKDRYVTLFNEPNHGQEWGGAVDPVGYAQVIEVFAQALHDTHEDFFVMPAGFDASAPSAPPRHQDEAAFVRTMVQEIGVEDFNRLFDGWASHSYPNPGFSASVNKRGRESITTYDWELSLLQSMGVKELPVFIKETGWNGDVLSREQIAENFRIAYEEVWIPDDRVVAVTPFILNYQGEPFLKFSWVKEGNSEFQPEYFSTLKLDKPKGDPDILNYGLYTGEFPQNLVEDSEYVISLSIKNLGQAIWDEKRGYYVVLEDIPEDHYEATKLQDVRPNEESTITVKLRTDKPTTQADTEVAIYKNARKVLGIDTWEYQVEPLPRMVVQVPQVLPFYGVEDYQIRVYDMRGELRYDLPAVQGEDGTVTVERVRNVSYDRQYRVELRKPYYLGSQKEVTFSKQGNDLLVFPLLPVDFSNDGRLSLLDLQLGLKQLKFLGFFMQ